MNKLIYKVEFFTDWNCSSGLSGGLDTDTAALKDENGLPYIPGKTIKGLLRDAAEILDVSNDIQDILFGYKYKAKKENEDENEDKHKEQQGQCFFTNAEIPKEMQNHIVSNESVKTHLFRDIAATAIDKEEGFAKKHSLRKIEVAVPMTVYGEIEYTDEAKPHIDYLQSCMHYIKRLGLNRNRGLGRCQFSVIKKEEA